MTDGHAATYTAPERLKIRKVGWRTRASRIRALMLTAFGMPKGFFTQYAFTHHLQPVAEPYPEVEALCAASPWRETLEEIAKHREAFASFGTGPADPVLGRGMFPALDGMAAYAMVRKYKPQRILEIGSGNSTHFLARAVKDNGMGRVTCIDPEPRHEISALDVDFKPRLMINSDAQHAGELEANDILFIDSSHIMLPGMDVDIQFNRLFPRLKPGVIVHIHDIFLPDDYPPTWRNRHYTEQNALVGWLVSGFFEIVWPAQYALTRHRQLVNDALSDIAPTPQGGSVWLRRAG
jgi:predicted O-methyltransferase YrrM